MANIMERRSFLRNLGEAGAIVAMNPHVGFPFQNPASDACRGVKVSVHVEGLRQSGSQFDQVADYLRYLVTDWLDPVEAEFFGGLSAVKNKVDELFKYELFGVARLVANYDKSKVVNACVGGCGLDANLALLINTEGAWWKHEISAGGYPGSGVLARVFCLLHEFGHLVGAPGFQDDLNQTKAGKDNDRLIHSHFRKTINNAATWGQRNPQKAGDRVVDQGTRGRSFQGSRSRRR